MNKLVERQVFYQNPIFGLNLIFASDNLSVLVQPCKHDSLHSLLYLQHCVKVFGAARCMYGSDYPVFSRTTAKYKDVFNALVKCLEDCTSAEEREDIFCNNAVRIYKIKAELNKESLA